MARFGFAFHGFEVLALAAHEDSERGYLEGNVELVVFPVSSQAALLL